jgi:hypothetical protein
VLLSLTGRIEFLLNFQWAFSSSNYIINVQFILFTVVQVSITLTLPSGHMCVNISVIFVL